MPRRVDPIAALALGAAGAAMAGCSSTSTFVGLDLLKASEVVPP